jgi:fido (protein-threonine AMPylation protein)
MMDAKPGSYRWMPIDDLPANHVSLASQELRSLQAVWLEQRDQLERTSGLQQFTQRLNRRWAIETGIIEGVYALDLGMPERGVTQMLIERGIDASLIPLGSTDRNPELVAQMIRDHMEVADALFDFVKGNRPLSTSFIKEVHAVFTRNQATSTAVDQFGKVLEVPLLSGDYKKLPNNPLRPDGSVHEYAPPEQVASEMDTLIKLHHEHERGGVPPEIEAAWLHHRFTQIHPFQDGNGRVARALASLVFIRHECFPVLVTRDQKHDYIAALEMADCGDLGPLIGLFVSAQRKTFVEALGIADDVLEAAKVDLEIEAARAQLAHRREALRLEWEKARTTAAALRSFATDRVSQVADQLTSKLAKELPDSEFFQNNCGPTEAKSHYFRWQIVQSARKLGYFANTETYRAWTRLVLRGEAEGDGQSEILLSIHGIGHEYRGVLAAVMCFYRRQQTGDGDREVGEVTPISDDVFQINYRESQDEALKRFEGWFEQGLAKGLQLWRSGL